MYLYRRGLAYKDLTMLIDEEYIALGLDIELSYIKRTFIYSHVMYWSMLSDTDDLELFVPSTINPLTEDDVCTILRL